MKRRVRTNKNCKINPESNGLYWARTEKRFTVCGVEVFWFQTRWREVKLVNNWMSIPTIVIILCTKTQKNICSKIRDWSWLFPCSVPGSWSRYSQVKNRSVVFLLLIYHLIFVLYQALLYFLLCFPVYLTNECNEHIEKVVRERLVISVFPESCSSRSSCVLCAQNSDT